MVEGRAVTGLASEGLPPKWFTKDPETVFEQDLAEMVAVIKNASRIGKNAGERVQTFFAWWRALYDEQSLWSQQREVPALLANLGTSLIERAVLDGLCKGLGQPLHSVLQSGALAIDLGSVRPELAGMQVTDVVSPTPPAQVQVRHTIGLGDPLRMADLSAEEQMHDGLPYALDESIRAYGLRYFKIKVCGKPEQDLARLLAEEKRHTALLEQVALASRSVNSVLSADSIARILTEEARAIIGARVGATTFTRGDDGAHEVQVISVAGGSGALPAGSEPAFDPELVVAVGRSGQPAKESSIKNIVNTVWTPEQQRKQFDLLRGLNAEQAARHGVTASPANPPPWTPPSGRPAPPPPRRGSRAAGSMPHPRQSLRGFRAAPRRPGGSLCGCRSDSPRHR